MQIDRVVKEFRQKVESLYGDKLKKLILYGSHARGEATEDSDIDLAVVLEGDVAVGQEIDRLIDIVTEINLDYGVLISVYPVAERDYATVNSPLLLNLRREGVPACKEVSALIDRAQRYLKSADILLMDGDHESAVSRTYYAMFYCAQAVLLSKNLSYSSHKGVISAFGEHFIKTGIFPREMGKELNRAFEKRQIGDYEYTFVVSREDAEQLLESGRQFVSKVADQLQKQRP